MFDCLVSADLSVDDPDRTAALLVDVLGLPEPRPTWVLDHATADYKAYFLRANTRRIGAPTAIEVIGPHPVNGYGAGFRYIHAMQRSRPMKTHAIVFSVPEIAPLADRLTGLGVPFRIRGDKPDDPIDFPRIFVGQSESDPESYDGHFDAGLVVEFIPTRVLAFRNETHVRTLPDDVVDGGPVRVESRSAIVADLDESVAVLDRYLDLQPTRFLTDESAGARVALYRGSSDGSATFELMAPSGDGAVAAHLADHGPGAYRITIGVNGLDAAIGRLGDRGITTRRSSDGVFGERAAVDPAALDGHLFDLVDATY